MTFRPLLLLALLAEVTCSPAQTPAPTAQDPKDKTAVQQGEEQTKVPSEFARFVRKDDGGHLDTAVVTYRNKDGAEVTLLGAVHIADRSHYVDLQERFQRCDALLYELVGPENYRPKPGEHGSSWVSLLQGGMKNALDLEFQLDAVDYDKPNFVHADMTPKEFTAAQEKAGESIIGLMVKAMMQEMKRARDGENEDPGMAGLAKLDLVTAFQNGEGRHLLRMVFASQLQNVERVAAGFGPDGKGSVLVEGRNEKCLSVLQRELKAGKRKLGIYYGAAHLPHMEQRLVKDLGFTKVKQEWVVAWDCAKRPDKKPDAKKPNPLLAAREAAKLKKAQADVRVISDAVKMYLLQHSVRELPTMETLTTKDEKGVAAVESSSKDPWGTDYEIRRGERISLFEVVSAGPDRQFGTEDDISSRKLGDYK